MRSTGPGGARRNSQESPTVSASAMVIPSTGETTINATGSTQPPRINAPNPAFAMAAPAYPPSRAWDDELGSPRYHVTRSQMIAPSSPARITSGSTMLISIKPLPMVLATAVPTAKAATKLKKAAQNTAFPGLNTRVDTTVAIELALSWKPLMKSNTSATATIMTTYSTTLSIVRRA